MKKIVNGFLSGFGLQLKRLPAPVWKPSNLDTLGIGDLESISKIASNIQGMISIESGRFLYCLCMMQSKQGDVVEIGSWQGRSTAFLAQAVKDSRNGTLFAIDHFQGNVGKEHFYQVGKKDLSDLKGNFEDNMKHAGVEGIVNLLDMPNNKAKEQIADKSIRFLFIDGDHTEDGVKRDIELFLPLLSKGSLLVFDDYSKQFPGVVDIVNNLIGENSFANALYYEKTMVIRI